MVAGVSKKCWFPSTYIGNTHLVLAWHLNEQWNMLPTINKIQSIFHLDTVSQVWHCSSSLWNFESWRHPLATSPSQLDDNLIQTISIHANMYISSAKWRHTHREKKVQLTGQYHFCEMVSLWFKKIYFSMTFTNSLLMLYQQDFQEDEIAWNKDIIFNCLDTNSVLTNYFLKFQSWKR